MKTIKTTTMCMALLGLAVLFVACNGGKTKEFEVSERHNYVMPDLYMYEDPIIVSNYDTVIVGNFTGEGLDTLFLTTGRSQEIPMFEHDEDIAGCGTGRGNDEKYLTETDLKKHIMELFGDEICKCKWSGEGNDGAFVCEDSFVVQTVECKRCKVLSSNKKIPVLNVDSVPGKPHLIFFGDLDGNGTDEWGCLTLGIGGYSDKGESYFEGDCFVTRLYSYEYPVDKLKIFTLVNNQWKCLIPDVLLSEHERHDFDEAPCKKDWDFKIHREKLFVNEKNLVRLAVLNGLVDDSTLVYKYTKRRIFENIVKDELGVQ